MLPRVETALEWMRSFTLHVLTGFVAVAVHYSLMWLFLQLGAGPLMASGGGFAGGAMTRFLLSHFKVFAPTRTVPVTLVKFITVLAAQMTLNLVLLELLMAAGLGVWIAQVCATILLTFANFVAYRLWVFR